MLSLPREGSDDGIHRIRLVVLNFESKFHLIDPLQIHQLSTCHSNGLLIFEKTHIVALQDPSYGIGAVSGEKLIEVGSHTIVGH